MSTWLIVCCLCLFYQKFFPTIFFLFASMCSSHPFFYQWLVFHEYLTIIFLFLSTKCYLFLLYFFFASFFPFVLPMTNFPRVPDHCLSFLLVQSCQFIQSCFVLQRHNSYFLWVSFSCPFVKFSWILSECLYFHGCLPMTSVESVPVDFLLLFILYHNRFLQVFLKVWAWAHLFRPHLHQFWTANCSFFASSFMMVWL